MIRKAEQQKICGYAFMAGTGTSTGQTANDVLELNHPIRKGASNLARRY